MAWANAPRCTDDPMRESMKDTVAVLGTGKMGAALVRAFAAAGHSVVAWNRTPARADPLRTVARLAGTPAIAARDAILAQPNLIATEYATVFYAGDRTLFDAHKPTLQALANNTVFVADAIGSAAALDCAILEAYYGGCLASCTLRRCVSPKEFLHPGFLNTSDPS